MVAAFDLPGHASAAPQFPDLAYTLAQVALACRITFGGQDEIGPKPAGSEGDIRSAARQIVHHRPFLGNPDRIVKRGDDAARGEPDVLRHPGKAGGEQRWIGMQGTKLHKMALGQPYSLQAGLIGKTRRLMDLLVAADCPIVAGAAREKHDAEIHHRAFLTAKPSARVAPSASLSTMKR
jgi:hypothetical protein